MSAPTVAADRRPRTETVSRTSVAFHPGGQSAACLASVDGDLEVESWSWADSPDSPDSDTQRRRWSGEETLHTQPIPVGDGRVVLVRNGFPTHEIVLLGHGADGSARSLATLEIQALRLLPCPDPEVLAIAIGADPGTGTDVWRVTENGLQPLVRMAGRAGSGVWLDDHRLGLDQILDGHVAPVVVDLRTAAITPLCPHSEPVQLLIAGGPTAVVTLGLGPASRLARCATDGTGGLEVLTGLDGVTGSIAPLAVSPDGVRIALRATRGARSHLIVHHLVTGEVREVDVAAGTFAPSAVWNADGLRFLFAAPDQPTTIVTVDPDRGRPSPVRVGPGPAGATLVELAGPAGPIEAVVYGGPEWRHSRHLLIALHGGPESAWQMVFDPLFQQLADSGVAVVALNQRGSTGYGSEHRRAIQDAWGVADLADVLHVAGELTAQRPGLPGLRLYGVSYGAYLALLAAGAAPQLWSACVAAAPFLSGSRLWAQASEPVRVLIERLGGQVEATDAFGSRDVLRLADQITARLLVLHGTHDNTVPVDQSRQLRDRLLAAGREIEYREVPGSHYLLDDRGAQPLIDRIVEFVGPDAPGATS